MPTLNWIGKEKVINHHQDVPYKILEPQYGFTDGVEQTEPNHSGNKIIHGDNYKYFMVFESKNVDGCYTAKNFLDIIVEL